MSEGSPTRDRPQAITGIGHVEPVPRRVRAMAGGGRLTHLVPAGIFQPSSVLPAAVAEDSSLWRNIERELAEELLGHDEYDGSGHPIAYSNSNLVSLMRTQNGTTKECSRAGAIDHAVRHTSSCCFQS